MWFVKDGFGGFFKIAMLVLFIVTAMGFMSTNPATGEGFSLDCRTLTDDPGVNEVLCRIDPRQYLNQPISELLPFLAREDV